MNWTSSTILGRIVPPQEIEQRQTRADENRTRQVHDEIEQAVDDMAISGDVFGKPCIFEGPGIRDCQRKHRHAQNGHQQKQKAPKSTHGYLQKSMKFLWIFRN